MASLNLYTDPAFKVHGLPDAIAMNYANLMLQDVLMSTQHIQQAAIVDIRTHSVKANSVGLKLEDDVINSFLSAFNDTMNIRQNGISYDGKLYKCVRAEKHAIYGKLGKSGLVLVKTNTLMIVASFSENMLGSVCVEAVEKLADYFRQKKK